MKVKYFWGALYFFAVTNKLLYLERVAPESLF